ncbi:Glu/Leu/Phe/Val family dehydrogenase [Halothermothrix orenii]|uniref:Glu/Leu/Phe/Val dehydrogenase n=1 Tax=Halothermothrix orenii (strain H 168 / OCM 544 / DSM 9562) TaxID=373903 RepID=B8CVW3_HALOH|nr:Glu/Leu/Phe/Val dehydrogenase [Halothermothrix orenii]ACL69432.1 Glu/Leu/Phe/Val dehydrogenase [Halothermothrix orenii H 168]
MKIFDYLEKYDYEQLVFNYDEASGLKAIIAIHDTTLGPALGGTRMWYYEKEEDAIIDVLRLSRGMTYKSAAAGLNLGGGKAVIIGDPKKHKSEELWRAFGRFVQSLNGRYITAEDVGTSVDDMAIVAQETDFVTGLPGTSGDPSPVTALGVWRGMKAAADEVYGTPDLKGKVVAIQGLGHVGYYLAKHIVEEGGKLIVTDIDKEKIKKVVDDFGAEVVEPDEIYGVECDIFAPCALGAVINDETLPQFKCDIVAGAANNVLAEERNGDILEEKGILYAPDYVINAGGVINVYQELIGYNRERALEKANKIYDNIKKVIEISKRDNIPTYKAADIMAEERIAKIGKVRKNYIPR